MLAGIDALEALRGDLEAQVSCELAPTEKGDDLEHDVDRMLNAAGAQLLGASTDRFSTVFNRFRVYNRPCSIMFLSISAFLRRFLEPKRRRCVDFHGRGSYQEALQAVGHDMLITKALDVALGLRYGL